MSDCEELVGGFTGDDGMGNEVNKNHKAHPNLSHPMTRVVVPLKFDFVRRYLINKLDNFSLV